LEEHGEWRDKNGQQGHCSCTSFSEMESQYTASIA
jgi:hypothetical protein